jgi:hypothetical protein
MPGIMHMYMGLYIYLLHTSQKLCIYIHAYTYIHIYLFTSDFLNHVCLYFSAHPDITETVRHAQE